MTKISQNNLRLKRKKRVRAKVFGTAKIPRLAIFRSLKNLYVQAIDDTKGKTLIAADLKEVGKSAKNNIESAKKLGKLAAKKCLAKKINQVVFDRGGFKYHGRVKALAEEMRKDGIKI